ncbi:hypothetical protein [Streptomyces sp. NPDC029003]|uniref:hypothetical protein n=1 Tax=Streptomyces sp. NPDC029003 TaxID=3155125 RepID=UPI0033E148F4
MNERPPVAPMPVKPPKPPKPPRAPRVKRPAHAVLTDVLLVVLAVASLGLSGWSLATLLMEAGAPVRVAALGVGVFDLMALAAGLQVYARRSAPHTAGGARLVMMLALIASSIVNGAHGVALGGWTTAVVLAAAPLSFEVVFELRHRTLTALIWMLWREQAWTALRRDAWERIAPVAAAPTVTIEREHQAVPEVEVTRVPSGPDVEVELERLRAELLTVSAVLAALETERPAIEAEAAPVTAERDAEERTTEALAAYGAVLATPGATADDREWVADKLATAARRDGGARPADTSPLVKSAATGDVAPGGEPEDRVPEQRPPSINAGVAELRAAGIEDPEVMTARLSALRGGPVSLDSVKRAARAQRAAEREAAEKVAAAQQTGQYL